MKKLLLSAAMLLAASTTFAQSTANNNSNHEYDKVDVLAKVKICDLIDLAPECQVACAEVCDWDAFTDYTCLKEFTPGTPTNLPWHDQSNLEFRVSANRSFKVSVKGEDFQGPQNCKIDACDFKLSVKNGDWGQGVNNFYALNGFGGYGNDLPTSEKDILKGTGGYNKLFIVKICLKPYKAFDKKPGEYCANIKFKAYLCD